MMLLKRIKSLKEANKVKEENKMEVRGVEGETERQLVSGDYKGVCRYKMRTLPPAHS
jgi:hypothetical protein